MAVKTSWNAGDVLTAADLTDTFAAKAALAGATYTGTHDFTGATVVGLGIGLTLITTNSFTTASAVNVNGCFSGTYSDYLILATFVASTNNQVDMRMRVSAVDAATNYQWQLLNADSTLTGAKSTGQTSFYVSTASTGKHTAIISLFGPARAEATNIHAQAHNRPVPAFGMQVGQHTTATAYDGFSLIPSTGTITGSLSVFGYK